MDFIHSTTTSQISACFVESLSLEKNVIRGEAVSMPTENELRNVSGDLFRLHAFLYSRLGGDEGIQQANELIRHDRFTGEAKMAAFLLEALGKLPEVNETLIQQDPLLAMLVLILKDDSAEDHWRDAAADAYIAQYPEDKRFEKAYVYLKSPQILLTHLLVSTSQLKCANPENTAFYDEQIAGLFHGTIAFDKGDQISSEELGLIQQQEGTSPSFPIMNKLEKNESFFTVKDWCCTPVMSPTKSRVDDLFIPSRRGIQERVLSDFLEQLIQTSAIVQKAYSLPQNESTVVAVIGPYGAGKSKFVEKKFLENITVYSLDRLNENLKSPLSRPQDHHFEAMMLTSRLLAKVAEVPVLLTEVAAIDEFRFNRLVNRDFVKRERIIIEEIAPKKTIDSVNRLIRREFSEQDENMLLVNKSRIDAATTSSDDALRYRSSRIQNAAINSKIDYTLYCSETNSDGEAIFCEIATTKNGAVSISKGRESTFNQLISKQEI